MAASDRFSVDLEALAGSAAHVAGQGEDLATAHLSSDNRIAAAQSGWVGDSAAALQVRTTTWLETSRRLLTRVGEHALNLNNDGIDFAATERDNIEKLRAVQPAVDP
jgi:WXG100 family type VII secretion target